MRWKRRARGDEDARMKSRFVFAALASLVSVACGSKDDGGSGAGGHGHPKHY